MRIRHLVCCLAMFAGVTALADTASAADSKPVYASMAPLSQYRIASAADEVELAQSAAPKSVSDDADVLILGEHGYETSKSGKNGFVCLVERSWANDYDDEEFWNPKIRAPMCLNAAAVRSVLPEYLERTKLVLNGVSSTEMAGKLKETIAANRFVMPEPGAMCYMMSKQGFLSDANGHWHPHVMFFVGNTDERSWGANLKGSPVFGSKSDQEPVTTFFVPVEHWSDGTAMEMGKS